MTKTGAIKSGELMGRLRRAESFASYVSKCSDGFINKPFNEYLHAQCKELGINKDALFQRSDIDRGYGYKILSGERFPSRDTVVRLAFGMGLDVDGAQDMLRAAQKRALHPRVERDAAILFCLMRDMTLVDCQLLLTESSLPILGKAEK